MTHVSQKKLNKSTDDFLDKLITSTFSNLSSSNSNKILSTIISETEREMIKKRLGIILFLELGTSVYDITQSLKVTRQTVGRTSMQWKMVPEVNKKNLRSKLKATFTKESAKDLFKNLDFSYSTTYRKLRKKL